MFFFFNKNLCKMINTNYIVVHMVKLKIPVKCSKN